jgi:hypothetical protein
MPELNELVISHQHVRYWLLIISFLMMILLALMIFWNVNNEISATGLLLTADDIIANQQHIIKSNDLLNDKLIYLELELKQKQALFSQHNLTIDDLINTKNSYIQSRNEYDENAVMADAISTDILVSGKRLYALLLVAWQQGSELHVGMNVDLKSAVSTARLARYISGKVISFSSKPLPIKAVNAYFGRSGIVASESHDNPVYLLLVEINRNSHTSYLHSWLPVNAKIVIDQHTPLQLLLQA